MSNIEYYIPKLALGTVQFGVDYGISNNLGKTSKEEVNKILSLAFHSGIDTLDTAIAYGDSEELIGLNNSSRFKIVSKFSNTVSTQKELVESLDISLRNLKLESIYGYFAHDAESLLKFPELWETLQGFKYNGSVQKIGYSLYCPEQLDKLLELNFVPDLIQIPFNLFDHRFIKYLPILKANGCEVHARSIFLQGLFFMDNEKLSDFFDPIKPLLVQLKYRFPDLNILASCLLRYVLGNPHIDKVIFGVNSEMQLKNNLHSLSSCIECIDVECNSPIPEEILMPHKWPK